MIKARYQISLALSEEQYETLKELRKAKFSNMMIFEAGLKTLSVMDKKAKDLVK